MDKNENNNNNIKNDAQDYLIDRIFFKKYRCIQKIGQGSFGFIYKAECDNKFYALKFENSKTGKNILKKESSMLIYLKGPNIPYIKTYGTSGDYNILVMQLLGEDLQSLLLKRKKFSIKTVCLLAYQMITILEYIHNKNIIHRDIKPENFLMGLNEFSKYLYLTDFGLSKPYDRNSSTHYTPNNEGRKLTGTPRYASINALRGLEQGPRDDLESIGYVLVYLLKGELPWQRIVGKSKAEKIKKLLLKKIEFSSTDLCNGLPNIFERYIDYCKDLQFGDTPDYQMLKNLFIQELQDENEEFDYNYDWSKSVINSKKDKNINYNKYASDNNYENNNNNQSNNDQNNNNNQINIVNTEDRPIIVKNSNVFKEMENENNNDEKEENQENENQENQENKQTVCCCLIY